MCLIGYKPTWARDGHMLDMMTMCNESTGSIIQWEMSISLASMPFLWHFFVISEKCSRHLCESQGLPVICKGAWWEGGRINSNEGCFIHSL